MPGASVRRGRGRLGQTYEFRVKMTCGACSKAVTNALTRLEGRGGAWAGLEGFKVSLETQQVLVTTNLPQETVQQALLKTGKATTYVGVAQQ